RPRGWRVALFLKRAVPLEARTRLGRHMRDGCLRRTTLDGDYDAAGEPHAKVSGEIRRLVRHTHMYGLVRREARVGERPAGGLSFLQQLSVRQIADRAPVGEACRRLEKQ